MTTTSSTTTTERRSPPDRLLNLDDLCELLSVSPNTVYAWRSHGRAGTTDRGPKAYKIGRSLRWRRDDVEAWLETQLDQ